MNPCQKPAMCIILSGLPCTGKSTWGEQFAGKLRGLTVKVISSDAISYQICEEYNTDPSREPLDYASVWRDHRSEIEDRYKSTIDQAKIDGSTDIIIFDRTHTTLLARKKVLEFAKGVQEIHLVSFQILNEAAWNDRLEGRNESHPDKKITPAIISILRNDASPPEQAEGFSSICACLSIGELGWEIEFENSINKMIEAYHLACNKIG
ncbi:MAG: AAA family ATPase [Chlamydiales bacterium]